MSPRRNASVVVALAVASLAATSLAAMVASSELLAESFTGPLPRRLDPPAPDLGTVDTIQVEPPEKPAKRPTGPSRSSPDMRPPRRPPASRPVDRAGGVVLVAQRRLRPQEPVVRTPTPDAPPPPPARHPVRPSRPGPPTSEPEPPQHPRFRRPAGKPRPHRPEPPRPDEADEDREPRAGSPCPDRTRWREEDEHGSGKDRHRGDEPTRPEAEHRSRDDGRWREEEERARRPVADGTGPDEEDRRLTDASHRRDKAGQRPGWGEDSHRPEDLDRPRWGEGPRRSLSETRGNEPDESGQAGSERVKR